MQSTRLSALALFLALGFACAVKPAHADDACIDFKWDVSKERALFAGTATALKSAKESTSAPAIVPNRLYTLKIAAAGAYRIAMDLPVWIDVVSSGGLVSAKDFEGQRNCSAPHKIVEFDLSGAQSFMLQLSGGISENILLTVTASPVRKF